MTLGAALEAFLMADTTLATKVSAVYPTSAPQQPPDCYASYRFLPGGSGKTLEGATDLQRMRIEVTFWGKISEDLLDLCTRTHNIVSSVNGPLVTGGPFVSVYQTIFPRSVQSVMSRYYGYQIDIMALVNLGSV